MGKTRAKKPRSRGSLFISVALRSEPVISKLLNISLNSSPSTERYIWTQLSALAKLGVEVEAACGAGPGSDAADGDAGTAIRTYKVQVTPLLTPRFIVARLSKILRTAWHQNSEGATEVELNRWAETIACAKPDVVLVQFGTTAARVLPVLKSCGRPWAVQFHGFDATERKRHWGYRLALRSVLSAADAVLGCSAFVIDQLKPYCARSAWSKLHVVGPGYDETLFRQIEKQPRPKDRLKLISIARLVEVKGHDITLRAISKAKADCELSVVGDGEKRSELEALIKELGLSDRVRLLGSRSPAECAAELRAADIFVQSSIEARNGAREGLGLGPIEAAATGLPIVVSNSGGLAETCRHGVTGFVYSAGDAGELAAVLDCLSDDWPSLRRMGKAGAEFASATYASAVQAKTLARILQCLPHRGVDNAAWDQTFV
jgi:glycosyltransferase involved in cell wall biosynthesis